MIFLIVHKPESTGNAIYSMITHSEYNYAVIGTLTCMSMASNYMSDRLVGKQNNDQGCHILHVHAL